jgi:glycerophosphoryl diester phosphodiesterase
MAPVSDPPAPGKIVEPFDVQGHRGARGLLPENTLEGFRRALELGVSTLEMDLGMTRDGVVVVSHDPHINGAICRHPDGRSVRGETLLLKDLTLAEVQAFDCGSLNPDRRRFPEPPRRNIPGARIPTLAEVFELATAFGDDQVHFNIETKIHPTRSLTVTPEAFVTAILAVVREHGMEERVILQSFDWRTLHLGKSAEPRLRTAALLAPDTLRGPGGGPSPWLHGLHLAPQDTALDLLQAVRGAGDYVDIFSPDWRLVESRSRHFLGSSVAELRAAGFPVIPWTVNDPEEMERMLTQGVEGLITDYPDRLLERLRRWGVAVR